MKTLLSKVTTILFAIAILGGSFAVMNYSKTTEAKSATVKKKPTVVFFLNRYCHSCQGLKETITDLMKDYGKKLDFVILDVTDETAEAKSNNRAKALGLASFFNANKKKSSTVAIFSGNKKVFHTVDNYSRSAYVSAFDKALE